MDILNVWYQLKSYMSREASSLAKEIVFTDRDFGKRHHFRVSKLSAPRTYIDAWLNTSGEIGCCYAVPTRNAGIDYLSEIERFNPESETVEHVVEWIKNRLIHKR